MIRYYSRSQDDVHHLYKYDGETNKFYYMDHCWTGQGIWYERDFPSFDIVEIDEQRALEITKGNLYGNDTNEKKQL